MYNLQELIENGYIEKIEVNNTHLGRGYDISVKLWNYSIGSINISVGIDESLDNAITLINNMVEVDSVIAKQTKGSINSVREAANEELKALFEDCDETRD